jgi:hypothetical protein
MADFSQYGTADYANKMADKLSGFNLPENVAARRNVQIGQQEQEMKLRQMQQEVQDKEQARQAWKAAVEASKATGESPATIYRKNAANLGYAQATEAEKYDQELKKLKAPKYEFDKTTGQLVGIDPIGNVTVKKVEGYQPSMKLEGASNLRKLMEERNQFPKDSPEWNSYTNAIRKESETPQQITPRIVMPRQERMVAVIDTATNAPIYVPASEAVGMPAVRGDGEAPPKAQPGTRVFKDEAGNWQSELIPNQPAWQKAKSQYAQDTAAVTNAVADADKLSQRAEALAKHPGLAGNFGMRGYAPNVRGTDAANAEVLLSELKDSMQLAGFGALRSTSGSPGAMTEKEWPKLEAAIAKLQNASDVDQARSALADISLYAKRIKSVASSAYDNEWSGSQFANQNSAPVQGGDLHSKADAILRGR